MSYEAWRISYQSDAAAAYAAYREMVSLRKQLIQATSTNPAANPTQVKQPRSIRNTEPHIGDLVLVDMIQRNSLGAAKHGTHLQPFNGRDCLVDAYQEALDLCMYLRQAIYERDNPKQPEAKQADGQDNAATLDKRVKAYETVESLQACSSCSHAQFSLACQSCPTRVGTGQDSAEFKQIIPVYPAKDNKPDPNF